MQKVKSRYYGSMIKSRCYGSMLKRRYYGSMIVILGALLWSQPAAFAQASQSPNGPPPNEAGQALGKNTPQPVLSRAASVLGHHDSSQMLRLVLGLKHPHAAEEEEFLKELQDKSSPQFHHFLTADEWNKRFGPSTADEQALVDWAKAQGFTVTRRFPNRLLVDLEASLPTIERAFGLQINDYKLGAKSFFSNDRDPVVPSRLGNVLESVGGMNNLLVLKPALRGFKETAAGPAYVPGPAFQQGESRHADGDPARAPKKAGLKGNITNGYYDPADIWASTAYDYSALQNQGHCCNPTGNSGSTPADTSIAIATAYQFDGNDMVGFQAQYPYLAYHWQAYYIDGTPSCCNDETTLDLEWSTATSNSRGSYVDTSLINVFEGVNAQFSTFNDVYNSILSHNNTRVFSTSWGCAEYYCYDSSDASTAHGIFNSMAGQGWTLVAASGDAGSTADCAHVGVSYPGSDPDIVGAGGTTLFTGPNGYSSETGWQGGSFSGACAENDGGSTGGCSFFWAAPSYQSSPACGSSSRSVPDMSLNASVGENYYFNGSLQPAGGTSIVAPELAGFFAQANAYLLYLASNYIGYSSCYGSGTGSCVPIGPVNQILYFVGYNPTYPYHYPFYDITSGCNSNDITAEFGLTYYCAGGGYDVVTGWGSANMLQLAWAINTYIAGDFGSPAISFSGPSTTVWHNTDQTVSWSIADTSNDGHPVNGVAGYSGGWDVTISDPRSEAHPGSGNAFYSGPDHPNGTSGSTDVASVGQGCHYVTIYAWDNAGWPSGNVSYGPVCYDIVAPVTTIALSGNYVGGQYDGPVKVTLSASDNLSGVAATYYAVDSGGYNVYSSPFTVNGIGSHTVYYLSLDNAGNYEATKSVTFTIRTVGQTALQFVPVTPCRVVDTRNPNGAFGGPELPAHGTRSFTIPSSSCGIPTNAVAFSLNATVVPAKTLQYLTIWPAGEPQPNVSTLNSYDGRVKANALVVPGSSKGAISAYASDATQFILDINGYFVEAGSTKSGLAFYKLAPCRVVDTRGGNGSLGGPSLGGGTTRSFPVLSSSCKIPNNAIAYSFNYTAIPKKELGYLTTWATGKSQPNVSTLNAPTGTVTANAAIVPAGSSGAVSVYVSDATDLLVDVDGYFAPPASGGLSLYTLTPCRVLDTRSQGGAFSGTRAVAVETSSCSVNSNAQAYIFNATVVPPGALDYLTLWANGGTQPNVSTLNAYDGAVTSNMAIVPTSNGKIDAFASNTTQVILDISSYFAP